MKKGKAQGLALFFHLMADSRRLTADRLFNRRSAVDRLRSLEGQ